MASARVRTIAAAVALGAVFVMRPGRAVHGQETHVSLVSAVSRGELRTWDARVDRMIRDGLLELRLDREDTLIPGRRHMRFTQSFNGVPVYGGDLTRQSDAQGVTLSMFGTLYEDIGIPTEPRLSVDAVQSLVQERTGMELGPGDEPQLVILPRPAGSYTLAYTARVATPGDITLYFIDANTGAVIDQRSDAHRQTADVGAGIGVLGERKKISAAAQGGTFVASDKLRPPVIETYDMRGNLSRTINFLNGFVSLGTSDLASDSDNDWTDGANLDAHVYAGYTYDYYFKRFGRRGLDNANIRIRGLVHPVNRDDVRSASDDTVFTFYVNAFYAGNGIMVYGEGLPANVTLDGQRWNFLAGSLDVVAHELTHGVTDFTSRLIYQGQSGALNEAFSDIMATSIVFFFQQPGTGSGSADYIIGNDVVTPGGIRNMENPRLLSDYPDHFSRRYTGSEDNGGVHINSTIVTHAFYLAVEGGTNRTSGLTVQGVGGANREQMERVFYRAFTQLMPASATFATARAVTIQAAQELYGGGSAAERAVTQAWTAVGVN